MNAICYLNYLKHFFLSANRHGHGIHSPFLYRLTSMVLECKHPYYCFENQFNHSKKMNFIEKKELHSNEMLFRMVNDFQPKHLWLIESPESNLSPWIQQACQKANISRIQSIQNLDFVEVPDMVVVSNPDFTHEIDQELRYLLSIMPENCIFVFVHKHAKSKHSKLWKALKNDTNTSVSMDLFHTGLLFKRKEFKHKHYRIHLH